MCVHRLNNRLSPIIRACTVGTNNLSLHRLVHNENSCDIKSVFILMYVQSMCAFPPSDSAHIDSGFTFGVD